MIRLPLAIGLFSLALLGSAPAQIVDVWAVNDGEKVSRDDLQNPNRSANSVWDGRSISLFGAHNEVIAFQVIVASGTNGARQVEVSLSQLTNAAGNKLTAIPPSADPTAYRDGEIESFIEHYVFISQPSPPGWFYTEASAPKNCLGWVPDALVPINAAPGRGGSPFALEGARNQAVWFDIYLPKEAPSGRYTSDLVVKEEGRTVRRIPVALDILAFTLPDENHLPIMVFFSEDEMLARHGVTWDSGDTARELIACYHRLAHRHRVEFTDAFLPPGTPAQLDRLSGRAYSPANYRGPGTGVGDRIVPASFWEAGPEWRAPQGIEAANAFMRWIKQVKPDAITFLYLMDEPPKGKWNDLLRRAAAIRGGSGPGNELPRFVTLKPHPKLESSIDIWATVSDEVDLAEVQRQKALGKSWWFYNGQRPQSGTNITDAPAVDCRVFAWACWKYGIPLWYYWEATHWQPDSRPYQPENIWTDPATYVGKGGEHVNGDGVLIYPGQDAAFPAEDRGIAGPIASIRLKNIRRGAQDYEYLWLADHLGLQAQAHATADACLPRAFSEATADISWSTAGSSWDALRRKLGEAIAAQKHFRPSP